MVCMRKGWLVYYRVPLTDVLCNPKLNKDKMKSECKFNVEHSFQTIHLSPKTQITIYTHRRTDDMKIPDTVQYQVITLQKLSEHCFYLTNVYTNTRLNKQIYITDRISCHMLILAAKFGSIFEMMDRSTMILKCILMICTQTSPDLSSAGEREPPSYSGPISALTFTISMEQNTKYHIKLTFNKLCICILRHDFDKSDNVFQMTYSVSVPFVATNLSQSNGSHDLISQYKYH